ncbi:MAG: hypothetical protein JWO19_3023 [Bryobacterales bacterium]|jgi:hypothetical protein|nr:hypothetical protein [Bryobacterales bacterium]
MRVGTKMGTASDFEDAALLGPLYGPEIGWLSPFSGRVSGSGR